MIGDETGEIYGEQAFGLPPWRTCSVSPIRWALASSCWAWRGSEKRRFAASSSSFSVPLQRGAERSRRNYLPCVGCGVSRSWPTSLTQQRLFSVLTDPVEQSRFQQDAKVAAEQYGPEIGRALAQAGVPLS